MRTSHVSWLCLVLMTVVACAPQEGGEAYSNAEPGRELPELEVRGWLNAEEVTLADLRGEVVVVDCFFTTCGPCRAAAPELVRDYLKWREEGVRFIGLTWETEEQLPALRAFIEQFGTTWPIGYGATPFLKELEIYLYPTILVVGRDGRIRWDSHQRRGTFGRAIRDALAEPPPDAAERTASTDPAAA